MRILSSQSYLVHCQLVGRPTVLKHLEELYAFDSLTFLHSLRVGLLAIDIGIERALPEDELACLGTAALLHDIGKRDVPLEILRATRPLTHDESEIMHGHARASFLRLREPEFVIVQRIVVAHHEYGLHPYPRLDPGSHPQDARIVLAAQIVAVADMFDALVSARSYKGSFNNAEVSLFILTQFMGDQGFAQAAIRRLD